MKLNFLICFLSFQLFALSQTDSSFIKGLVVNTESQKRVRNAFVHLQTSKGDRYEYKTDSTGTYRFRFNSSSAFSCTLTIASDKHTSSGKFRNLGFLASKDHAIFDLQPGQTYEKTFELVEIPNCGPIAPSLFFYTNTLVSCNDSLSKRDQWLYVDFAFAIEILYHELLENPGIMFEIDGHASVLEKDPEQLSLKRAELVRQLLIEKGINPKRISVKGFGIQKLWMKDDMIKKAKGKEEKMILHIKNQRVDYRVINWDFKE